MKVVPEYARLKSDTNATHLTVVNRVDLGMLSIDDNNYHPTIDQTQDVWGNIQEVIAWEGGTRLPGDPMTTNLRVTLHVQALYTPFTGYRRNLSSTQTWGHSTYWIHDISPNCRIPGNYPSLASLNYRYDSTTENEKVLFSVAYHDSVYHRMDEHLVEYGADTDEQLIWGESKTALYGGNYPSSSANRVMREPWNDSLWNWRNEYLDRQSVRPAIIYTEYFDNDIVFDSYFRTTKQFFAGKRRPSGYMARGREAIVGLDDSTGSRFCVGFDDAWYATENSGAPLTIVERDSTFRRTDSLAQVRQLLRTRSFQGGDSVQIGYELIGNYFGDSSAAGDARIRCVAELVDSASGNVVARLDTFDVSRTSQRYREVREPVVDHRRTANLQ